MVRVAEEAGLASALVMFDPHPYQVLADFGYKPLFTSREREYLAGELGAVDYLLEYPFDRDFAAISPEGFCRMLFEDLQARAVVVGAGYRFGHKRVGTVETLRQMAAAYGAEIHVVEPHGYADGGVKTSTSTVRELLHANQLAEAESLLGYPFFVMGEAVPGEGEAMPGGQVGRNAGPLALSLQPPAEKFLPADGVYATRTTIYPAGNELLSLRENRDVRCYYSVAKVSRPAGENKDAPRLVETHLLDYNGGEVYGRHVRVEFLRVGPQ